MLNIRKAEATDVPVLRDIYNDEVLHGTATLDLHPKSLADRMQWFRAHNVDNHPLLVAETEQGVLGYVSLSPYREKEAYAGTVELSIYVQRGSRGQGIASALMKTVLEWAQSDPDTHTVVSVITSGNAASTRLHERFGFTYCGSIREVGVKFGNYLDIDNYQRMV